MKVESLAVVFNVSALAARQALGKRGTEASHISTEVFADAAIQRTQSVPCLTGFTDIDDTLYALHLRKGPVITYTDQRFKPYTEYAGVRAFYAALAGEYTESCKFRKVHLLSARNEMVPTTAQKLKDIFGQSREAYDFLEGSEDWTPGTDPHYYVKGAHEKKGQEGAYAVSKLRAIKEIFKGGDLLDRDKFAEVKFGNFKGFIERKVLASPAPHPHDQQSDIIVWNGDNGQGDMCAAQQMMQFAEAKGLKMLAFIHKVSEYEERKCDELVTAKYAFDELEKKKKIIYYWTYPDLAVKLSSKDGTFYKQILPQAAYEKVLAEAKEPPTGTAAHPVDSFGVPQCQKLFKNCRVSRVRKVYKCGSHANPVGNGDAKQIMYCKKLQQAMPDKGKDWPAIARERYSDDEFPH